MSKKKFKSIVLCQCANWELINPEIKNSTEAGYHSNKNKKFQYDKGSTLYLLLVDREFNQIKVNSIIIAYLYFQITVLLSISCYRSKYSTYFILLCSNKTKSLQDAIYRCCSIQPWFTQGNIVGRHHSWKKLINYMSEMCFGLI